MKRRRLQCNKNKNVESQKTETLKKEIEKVSLRMSKRKDLQERTDRKQIKRIGVAEKIKTNIKKEDEAKGRDVDCKDIETATQTPRKQKHESK